MWIPPENVGLGLGAYVEQTPGFTPVQTYPDELLQTVDAQHTALVTTVVRTR